MGNRNLARGATLWGWIAASCALVPGALPAEPAPAPRDAPARAATGAVIEYEEWGGGNVLYLEQKGSMLGGVAPPPEASVPAVGRAEAPPAAAAPPAKARPPRLPKLPRTEPPERP